MRDEPEGAQGMLSIVSDGESTRSTHASPAVPTGDVLDYGNIADGTTSDANRLVRAVLWAAVVVGVARAAVIAIYFAQFPDRLFEQLVVLRYAAAMDTAPLVSVIDTWLPVFGGIALAAGAVFLLCRHPGRRGRLLLLTGAFLLLIDTGWTHLHDIVINYSAYARSGRLTKFVLDLLQALAITSTYTVFLALIFYLGIRRRLHLRD